MSHILTQDIFLANIIFRTRNYFYFFQNCDFLPFVREGGPVAYGHLQLSILILKRSFTARRCACFCFPLSDVEI